MEIRDALEKRFGKEKVRQVFDYPIQDHLYPIPVARVVSVRGRNWLIDYAPRVDFRDGEKLDIFLEEIGNFYQQRFNRKLKMEPGDSVAGEIGFVMLGTRSKLIKDYLKNYGGF